MIRTLELEAIIEHAQKEAFNEALDWAAEHVKAYNTVPRVYSDAVVDKESILKGRI